MLEPVKDEIRLRAWQSTFNIETGEAYFLNWIELKQIIPMSTEFPSGLVAVLSHISSFPITFAFRHDTFDIFHFDYNPKE